MKNKNQLYKILSNPLIKDDPIYKIMSDVGDINNIYREEKDKNKKIFYFFRERIHKILHDSQTFFQFDENQDLKVKDISKNLSELFYLSLLVLNNAEYDYKYSFNYIILIFNYLKQNENNIKEDKNKMILKILDCIFENYNDIDEYEYVYGNEEKKNEINLFIHNNLNNYEIGKKKIDVIYLEKIISLIENYKFSDYQYCYEIIKELDLENIDITPTIFDGLSKTLNSDEEYIKFYQLKSDKDIKDETKINFYYILIIFILKNSIYIYNIEFLYKNVRNLRKINKEIKVTFDDRSIQIKIEEILKMIEIPNSNNNTNETISQITSNQNYGSSIDNELSEERNINNGNRNFSVYNSFNNSNEDDSYN